MAGRNRKTQAKKDETSLSTPTPKLDYSPEELNGLDKDKLIAIVLSNQTFAASIMSKLNEVTSCLATLSAEVTLLKANMNTVPPPSPDLQLQERVEANERENYALQQYSRRDSIEIVNFPLEVKDDKIEEQTVSLLQAIDVDVIADDIQACHRLFKKDRVIVKFVSRKKALECLYSKSKLKTLDKSEINFPTDKAIYINESLCPEYRRLFGKLNELKKQKKVQGVWTFNGSIRLRLNDDSVKTILHKNDIEKLCL